MTEILDAPTPSAVPPPLPPEAEWQPLPRRGALLYALGTAAALALPLALVPGLAAAALLHLPKLAGIALAGGAGLLLGGLVGVVRHRRIGWKLDADGFAIRRGGLWRVETLVPVSRVQHLDLERGPLERRLGLATLVVHTAGGGGAGAGAGGAGPRCGFRRRSNRLPAVQRPRPEPAEGCAGTWQGSRVRTDAGRAGLPPPRACTCCPAGHAGAILRGPAGRPTVRCRHRAGHRNG